MQQDLHEGVGGGVPVASVEFIFTSLNKVIKTEKRNL